MTFSYREELLENTDNVEELNNGKYQVKCPWCSQKFKSTQFLKAVNREGVHRAKQHIQREGKIPKRENGRDTKTSIVETWQNSLDSNENKVEQGLGSEHLVFKIAQINMANEEKL